MSDSDKQIQLNAQTVMSLDELVKACWPGPGQEPSRALRYANALVLCYRGVIGRRPQFNEMVVESLEILFNTTGPVPAIAALGLKYLQQQVARYRSPEGVAARAAAVEKMRNHRKQKGVQHA